MSTKKIAPGAIPAIEAEREKIIKALAPHLKPQRGAYVIFGTLVSPQWLVKLGQLKASDAKRIGAEVQRHMRGVPGVVRAVSSVELGLNVIENRRKRWSPHAHFLAVVKAANFDAAKAAVRNEFRCDNDKRNGIYRALVIKQAINVEKALSYITKSAEAGSTIRRSSWTDADGHRHTKRQALSKSELAEVEATWGKLQLNDRLTRVGFPLAGGGVAGTPKPAKVKKAVAVNSAGGAQLLRSGASKKRKTVKKTTGRVQHSKRARN